MKKFLKNSSGKLLVKNGVSLFKFVLPDAYKKIEYIESTGTQYINTNYLPTLTSKIRVKFAPTQTNGIGFFGSRLDPLRFSCTTFSSGAYFGFAMTNNTWTSNRTAVELNKIYDCTAYNGKQIINGTEYTETTLTSFTATNAFKLAGVDGSGNINTTSIKSYLCQIWDNNNLLYYLIPVKRISDSKPGMFDIINDVFYTNAGSGEFVAGPDI